MFAPSLGRVARSTSSISPACIAAVCRAGLSTRPTPFRPSHQRRDSSSKPAIPPSRKKKPAEDVGQSAASQLYDAGAGAKAKGAAAEVPVTTSMNNVPHVPPTTHLDEDDVLLSAFFAQHRPLPFHREAWQPPASMDVFEAVFAKRDPSDARSMEEIKDNLSAFVQKLYAAIDAAEEQQADAMLPQEPAHHPDGPPTKESIEFIVSQMPPFHPPPPPTAFDPSATNRSGAEVARPVEPAERPQTFRENVRKRREGMLLISVKRQRKLKMKKHKYKKLMKRTRLERRKLDRL